MTSLPSNTSIWIAADITDMRHGFTGLSAVPQTVLEQNPYSGHVFVFRGGADIKRDSAYRSGFVVVEYRWHPLYGKKLPLVRRTIHGGTEAIHVDVGGNVSRELPAWMAEA